MIGVPYWDRRLHRWGAWLATDAGRMSSTPLARMRQLGVRVQSAGENDAPMVHEIERETDAMVRALPARDARMVDAMYRCQVSVHELAMEHELHPDTIRACIRGAHKRMQRMLDERRHGEDRRPANKAVNILGDTKRGRGRTLASVMPEPFRDNRKA